MLEVEYSVKLNGKTTSVKCNYQKWSAKGEGQDYLRTILHTLYGPYGHKITDKSPGGDVEFALLESGMFDNVEQISGSKRLGFLMMKKGEK